MIATEYELSDINLIEEIEHSHRHDTSLFFAVESDDISEVVEQVGRIEHFAREEMSLRDPVVSVAQVVDAVAEQSEVATLMVTARREQIVRFIVVPVGARWWIRHLTGIPESYVRWATL